MIRPGIWRLCSSPVGQKRRVRAAEAHGHAEALGRADGDVGAPVAGRREQRERQQVGRGHDQGTRRVGACSDVAVVLDPAVGGRVLHQHAAQRLGLEVELGQRPDVQLDDPSGSARVRTTSMVCGWQSSAT